MDGRRESSGIKEMLEYIKEHNYTIQGPYLGEVVAEAGIFACDDRNLIVRQHILVTPSKQSFGKGKRH